MRGETERQATLMLGLTPERFVPRDHPLWRIKPLVGSSLGRMSPLFDEVYAAGGRPSIPPEHLLKASLLMAFYTIRSERQFCEQLPTTSCSSGSWTSRSRTSPSIRPRSRRIVSGCWRRTPVQARGRLRRERYSRKWYEARRRRRLSADHFTVDGTLLEAWASHKSYRPRDEQPPKGGGRNRDADFQGQRRSRNTHVSTTDPEARLYRKGKQQEARLCYLGHVLTENRYGLVVDVELTEADGYAERSGAGDAGAQRLWAGAGARPAAVTRATSSGGRAAWGDPALRTTAGGAARSMVGRRGMTATARVSAGASGSRKSAAGPRRSAEAASCAISVGPVTSSGLS